MIYFNFYLIYKIIQFVNGASTVPTFVTIGWTLYIVFTLQMIFSLIVFNVDVLKSDSLTEVLPEVTAEQLATKTDAWIGSVVLTRVIPFKGVASLIVYGLETINSKTITEPYYNTTS